VEVVSRLEAEAARHESDVSRLDRARRADTLRPLVALVDERAKVAVAASRRAETSLAAVGPSPDGMLPLESTLASALDDLTAELATVTALLPAEHRLGDLHDEVEARTSALRALAEADALEAAEAVAVRGRVERLTTELADADAALLALPEATLRLTGLQTVVTALDDQRRLEAELALARVDHSAAATRVLDLRGALLDLRERRIAGMAAELAGGLVVGDDCPVCGSAEHPQPARAVSGHPDAAAERAAQRAVDDAQAVETAVSMRVRDLERSLAACREAVGDQSPEEVRAAWATARSAHAALAAAADGRGGIVEALDGARGRARTLDEARRARQVTQAETAASLEHLGAELTALEATVTEARGADPALADVVERLEARRTTLRAAYDDASAHEAAARGLAEAETALRRAALEACFDTVAAARAGTMRSEDEDALERRVRDHEAALRAARMVLAEAGADDLLARPAPDVAALARAHREAADAWEQARGVAERATRLCARVAALDAELQAALMAWRPVRAELRLATAVSSFAEGKAPDNRLQMRLSAYVLAHRLSQVVAAANARLAGMSDRRYSLEHVGRRGAGETRGGLSLVVRDDWSGESRDPATLSGGETFVVSLALALGLADVVAHEAGGADLATLFVDEGFGSLDAETLDDVLDILDTLREGGRAVGVVSHVAEMRHRIPAQLVVTKARTGSTLSLAGVPG
jgi:exonuclease SbcC